MPVIWLSLGRSRSTTACVFSERSPGGLRVANMKPLPAREPPEKATTVSIAGSALMMPTACLSLSWKAVDEMLWSARRPPLSWPLSCCGK